MSKRRHSCARAALGAAAALAVGSIFQGAARAQTSINYSSGTYSQNFDTLPNSGTFAFIGPGPFDLSASPVNGAQMQGWQIGRAGAGNAAFAVSTGSLNTGSVYSFGSTGASDRALGSIASGSITPIYGAVFLNSGTATLNSFTINYTMEQWRNGGGSISNSVAFSYGIDATDILSGTFTNATSLNATSFISGAPATALDGNLAINQANVGATVGGLNWLPGTRLVVRWTDADDAGADHGIGIDEFSFFAAGGARSLIWNPAGAGGTTWTTSPAAVNWFDSGLPASFANGDTANFTDSGVGSVTVDGAGVGPGATNFTNDNGTYSITGGPITGSGALTKSGNGTVVLNAANSYTGGTVINGGVLVVGNPEALGAAQGGVTLGGGTLQVNAGFNSARPVTFSAGSVSTIATGAAATFGTAAGTGSFRKAGAGTVTFNGAYNIAGTTSVAGGGLVLGQGAGSVNLSANDLSDWAGDLTIANPIRVNFNSGSFAGGGKVKVNASGTVLSTTGALVGQTANVNNDVQLNANNVAGPFVTTIGATAQNTINLGGRVTGNSDVIFSSSTAGAGTGLIVLDNNNGWTGATTISNATAGVVRLARSNALPTTTNLVFGTGTFNAGALDLNGRSQSVHSLRSDTTGTVNGIANTGSAGETSVFTITGNATTTFAGSIGIPADVTNLPGANANISLVLGPTHTGELTLAGTNNHTGGTVIQGGALAVTSDAALGAPAAPINLGGAVGGGALRIRSASFSSSRAVNFDGPGTVDTEGNEAALLGPIGGPGTFNKAGSGTLNVTAVRSGGLNVNAGEVNVVDSQADGDGNVSQVNSLYIANGPLNPVARLDLNDNGMIAGSVPDNPSDGGGPEATSLQNTLNYLQNGYAGGGWTGNGITSGTAVDRPGAGIHGLGYAEAGSVNITVFGGIGVLPTDILIKFTRHGDADLNGLVNLADFNRLAANFGSTSAFWAQGDFNYNGIVNLQDFNLLAANFGLSAGPDGVVDPGDWAALAAAVPEPGSVTSLGLLACAAAARRRRRSRCPRPTRF